MDLDERTFPNMDAKLVEDHRISSSSIHSDRAKHFTASHAALKEAFAEVKVEGIKNPLN